MRIWRSKPMRLFTTKAAITRPAARAIWRVAEECMGVIICGRRMIRSVLTQNIRLIMMNSRGAMSKGRIFLFRWNKPEAEGYAQELEKLGWEVDYEWEDGARGGNK